MSRGALSGRGRSLTEVDDENGQIVGAVVAVGEKRTNGEVSRGPKTRRSTDGPEGKGDELVARFLGILNVLDRINGLLIGADIPQLCNATVNSFALGDRKAGSR